LAEPSGILSESLVAHAAAAIWGRGAVAIPGNRRDDLHVHPPASPTISAAVKGTQAGWISVTDSDRAADELIWLDYSTATLTATIRCLRFPAPPQAWLPQTRIRLAAALKSFPGAVPNGSVEAVQLCLDPEAPVEGGIVDFRAVPA
jgi:hypothetical protein